MVAGNLKSFALDDVRLVATAQVRVEAMRHRVRASVADCEICLCGKTLLCKVHTGQYYMQVIIAPKEWEFKKGVSS